MKKAIRLVALLLLLAVACLCLPALAAPDEVLTVFPVRITFTADRDKVAHFVLELSARDAANPMPDGTVDGVKQIMITNSGTADFGTISYTLPGDYYYSIRQVIGSEGGVRYDEAVYLVIVQVTLEDGALSAATYISLENAPEKFNQAEFFNSYSGAADPDAPKPTVNPDNPDNPYDPNRPQTGDESEPGRYLAILTLSLLGLCVCLAALLLGRRKQQRAER